MKISANTLWLVAGALAIINVALSAAMIKINPESTSYFVPIALILVSVSLIWFLMGGPGSFRVTGALLKRGMQVFASYKFQIVFIVLNIFLMVVIYFIVGKPFVQIMMAGMAGALQNYGATGYDFLTFILVGMIAWPMIWSGYGASSSGIRSEQVTGMFEIMIASKSGVKVLPFSYLILGIFGSITNTIVSIAVFTWLLGVKFNFGNPSAVLGLVAIILISLFAMWGIGLIFGGLTAVYKQLGPAGSMLQTIMMYFCGIYLPVTSLPQWIQPLSYALPATYAFNAIRAGMISGQGIMSYWKDATVLFAFCIAMVVVGYLVFNWCVNRARKFGTVHGY
ncbi:MAG: ABC transporter permease [Candidatus Thermoplasmatota archaeon]|nr:ABC transporter permease [Candidatus Thermoplasmatota archaeon]